MVDKAQKVWFQMWDTTIKILQNCTYRIATD